MTWQDRLELLEYHSSARDEQKQRLAQNAKNTLADFADELVKRLAIENAPSSTSDRFIVRTINELLTEAGVER